MEVDSTQRQISKEPVGNQTIEEDRISALPDPIIEHILSFLPLAKYAVRTGVLSKRWRNLWTRCPVLLFKPSVWNCWDWEGHLLPKSIFDSCSLVRLEIEQCYFMPSWRVNWSSLKSLKIDYGTLYYNQNVYQGIGNVVSGSPLLECLELRRIVSDHLPIVSKSMKVLSLFDVLAVAPGGIEISCPNLVEFSVESSLFYGDQIIVNVLLGSPFIHSLKLGSYGRDGKIVIASKSLKVLHLAEVVTEDMIEVSCPNLEKLDYIFFLDHIFKTVDLPSSVVATIEYKERACDRDLNNSLNELLEQFQHVKKLTIGKSLFKFVSDLNVEGRLSLPMLYSKCLTLNVDPNSDFAPGIAYALGSPMLEALYIDLTPGNRSMYLAIKGIRDLIIAKLDDLNSLYGCTSITCLDSPLFGMVEIIGINERNDKCKIAVELIEFLLKRAGVWKKVAVLLEKSEAGFVIEFS